jgi:hypothetical protein
MLPPSSQSAGRLELAGLPRDVALRGPCSIRAPLSRSRPLFSPGLLPVTDSRSSTGSSRPASHWRPLTPNRSEQGGLPCRRRCRTALISFLARVSECTSCSRRASRQARHRPPACFVGVSKTPYVLATPRRPDCGRALSRTSTSNVPPDSESLDPCRRLAGRHRGGRRARPPVAGVLVLDGGSIQRRRSQRAPWCA